MTVVKPVPCSLYDIRGMQEWLDEMALQGLFLKEFKQHMDRAVFEPDDPRPVRYRLEPQGKDRRKDDERTEPYAQMGWNLVCHIPKWYYIFSCGDPSAPELYSDPQSLALAMEPLIRRSFRNSFFVALLCAGVCFLCLLPTPGGTLRNLLLWERPQALFFTVLCPILLVLCLPLLVLDLRRIVKIRNTLAQGLPLKAKKRWNRPSFWAWYIPLWCIIFILPRLLISSVGWEVGSLETTALSHPWPDIVRTEALGPHPLNAEPYSDGYATENSSWFAPVQEERCTNWNLRASAEEFPAYNQYWTDVRYVRARSPAIAELIFQCELEDVSKSLSDWAAWGGDALRITGSTGLLPQDWPGVDRLEVARYRQRELDAWTFAALRGTDILVVSYCGQAQPEDCIGLFLEALDQ